MTQPSAIPSIPFPAPFPSRGLTAAIQHGAVTLTGALQYAIQRSPLLKEVGRVPGVVRVVDQLTLVDRKPSYAKSFMAPCLMQGSTRAGEAVFI